MIKNKPNDSQSVLQTFYSYWKERYPMLEKRHMDWLIAHSSMRYYPKDTLLTSTPADGQAIYIALDSSLARESYCAHCQRHIIHSIALPRMALFTTMHSYSDSPSPGDITVLHAGWVLRIRYQDIHPYREKEHALVMLINLLTNKENYQLQHLRAMDAITGTAARYLYFASNLPILYTRLLQRDQARLLHTSVSSIQRAKKIYLKTK